MLCTMATRTLARLRSGYRIPNEKNEGAMLEHLRHAIIGEFIESVRMHDGTTWDATLVVIKEEVQHVAKHMDERWVRRFAAMTLNMIMPGR